MGDSPRRRKGKEPMDAAMEEGQSSQPRNTRARRTGGSDVGVAGAAGTQEGAGPVDGVPAAAALAPEGAGPVDGVPAPAPAAAAAAPAPEGAVNNPYRDAQGRKLRIAEFGDQMQFPDPELEPVQTPCPACGRQCYNDMCLHCLFELGGGPAAVPTFLPVVQPRAPPPPPGQQQQQAPPYRPPPPPQQQQAPPYRPPPPPQQQQPRPYRPPPPQQAPADLGLCPACNEVPAYRREDPVLHGCLCLMCFVSEGECLVCGRGHGNLGGGVP